LYRTTKGSFGLGKSFGKNKRTLKRVLVECGWEKVAVKVVGAAGGDTAMTVTVSCLAPVSTDSFDPTWMPAIDAGATVWTPARVASGIDVCGGSCSPKSKTIIEPLGVVGAVIPA
jgi:hypothetical protein